MQIQPAATVPITAAAAISSVFIDLQRFGISKSMELLEVLCLVFFSVCGVGVAVQLYRRKPASMKASASAENLTTLGDPVGV